MNHYHEVMIEYDMQTIHLFLACQIGISFLEFLYFLNNVVHFALCSGEQLIVIPKVDYENLSLFINTLP